jgi:hypothetical protein
MKTEITIDGITYKVGDVLERETWHDREILAIGSENFFVKILYNKYESILCMVDLKHWKIKKPKKKVVIDFWVALTNFGTYSIWSKYESIPTHRDIVKTENVRFEYEVDEE